MGLFYCLNLGSQMIRKDFIQRHIDELAKVLAVVLKLKQNNEPESADIKLDEFGLNFLGLNLHQLILMPSENIIELLITQHQFEYTHFRLLEDLLYHKYLLDSTNKQLKTLTLVVLNYLQKTDKDFSFDRMNRIKELT